MFSQLQPQSYGSVSTMIKLSYPGNPAMIIGLTECRSYSKLWAACHVGCIDLYPGCSQTSIGCCISRKFWLICCHNKAHERSLAGHLSGGSCKCHKCDQTGRLSSQPQLFRQPAKVEQDPQPQTRCFKGWCLQHIMVILERPKGVDEPCTIRLQPFLMWSLVQRVFIKR